MPRFHSDSNGASFSEGQSPGYALSLPLLWTFATTRRTVHLTDTEWLRTVLKVTQLVSELTLERRVCALNLLIHCPLFLLHFFSPFSHPSP